MYLIQRCQAGDEDVFATLFHQDNNLAYKTAYLLLDDAQAAEDALQEVLMKVYRSGVVWRNRNVSAAPCGSRAQMSRQRSRAFLRR